MARACIAVNRKTTRESSILKIEGKEDAINALKHSVKLDNPSDWQLLVELTSTS